MIGAILGAGAMGSAIATPLVDTGVETRLWGTHLDTAILAALREGRPHPRTGVPLASGVRLFDPAHLVEALDGAELVVVAIASDGVASVIGQAAPHLARASAMLLLTKGLVRRSDGEIELVTDAVARVLADHGVRPALIGVGGPCKANEVAARRPTAAVFGAAEGRVAGYWGSRLSTPSYRPIAVDDLPGVEIAAALKNAYAIGLGICEGLQAPGGQPWHDLGAATFAQAIAEMTLIAELVRGRPATIAGLAGVGDLAVTGRSGRNRELGERIGRGERPADAAAAMRGAGNTIEGYDVVGLASQMVDRLAPELWQRLPLLRCLAQCIRERCNDLPAALAEAVLPIAAR